MVDNERWQRFQAYESEVQTATQCIREARHHGQSIDEWMRRPEIGWDEACDMSETMQQLTISERAKQQVVMEAKYAGYIRRQSSEIARQAKVGSVSIPEHFDYRAIPQLRHEAKDKLTQVRPQNLGQAGRISGITPADISILMLYLNDPSRLAS